MNDQNLNRHFFSRNVDKRSRKEMTDYLVGHFRYPTMNSWNKSTSYACNLKVHKLGLDSGTMDKLFELVEVPEFYVLLHEPIQTFNQRYDYRWQAGWNGRSGGYLVLYQGEQKPSEYRSFCTNCGQKNYTSVAKTGRRCGNCNEGTRVDYIRPPMDIVAFPGRGTDMHEDFEDWPLDALRQRTELVQDFDRLADEIVATAMRVADERIVFEETVFVPTKVRSLA